MIWKPLKSDNRYMVNEFGQVRGIRGMLPVIEESGDYLIFTPQGGVPLYVHRCVAEAYIPNPEGLSEVVHIDGNKRNNNVENLRWDVAVEVEWEKLSVEEKREKIMSLRSNGKSQKEIANNIGVSQSVVRRLIHGK